MALKKGYRLTEVGVIPSDWECKKLGEIADVVRGGSPRPAGDPKYFNGDFIPWLTVASLTNIPESIQEVTSTSTMLTKLGSLHSRILEKDTLIISNSGATLGVAKILGIKCCANDGVAALINQKSGCKSFLAHYINTKTKELHDKIATGNGQPNLNTDLIKNISVPFPPEDEQVAIAKALNDVDALITQLQRLITKKHQIKQGAMQSLLNPFEENGKLKDGWKQQKLGDTAILKARIGWQGLTTSEYLTVGDYFLITGTEFKSGFIDWDSCNYVEQERYKQDRNIQVRPHDVLVTKDGTIGKVAFIRDIPKQATLNSGVFVLRPINNAFCPEFFYYVLMSDIFIRFLTQLCAGSTINHLYQKDFINFKFYTPIEQKEQINIAKVLSEMDEEIENLSKKLTQTHRLKQGMMQSLLTGQIRLAAPN